MPVESALSLLIPLIVIAVLWTLIRHWVLPFVLGFVLAVALGPQARPLVAGAWETIAQAGRVLFGPRDERDFRQTRDGGLHEERDRDRYLGRPLPGPDEDERRYR